MGNLSDLESAIERRSSSGRNGAKFGLDSPGAWMVVSRCQEKIIVALEFMNISIRVPKGPSPRFFSFFNVSLLLILLAGCVTGVAQGEPAAEVGMAATPQGSREAAPPQRPSGMPNFVQLPPPGLTEEVLAFNAKRNTWEAVLLEDVPPGGELVHAGRLLRVGRVAGLIQWNNDVDVARLLEADATWDPKTVHRDPGAEDVVYVLGDDARHVLLPRVRDGEEFAFQGRIFETRISGGAVSVRPNGRTLSRVTGTFRRNADTLVALRIRYVGSGVLATLRGTPEHPVFVPARGDYLAMGELTAGMVLRADDGSPVLVVGAAVRHGHVEVFNLEAEHVHNYFVSPAGPDAPGVLVHNTCSPAAGGTKQTGSYTNTHASGKTYSGKGSRARSQQSGRRQARANDDPHTATDWTPAENTWEAFKQESRRLDAQGGVDSPSNYNKVESPGKRFRVEDGEL